MADAITFWLDNKRAAGTRLGQLDEQILVNYRDRYYLIVNGAATTRGGKALRYSNSSLPPLWKKFLKGEIASPPDDSAFNEDKESAMPKITMQTDKIKRHEVTAMPEVKKSLSEDKEWPKPPTSKSGQTAKKAVAKQALQTVVVAECPYCATKQDIPVEKGRNGKPFFLTCGRCSNDFAVKFVQVTVYQAQVAGFR